MNSVASPSGDGGGQGLTVSRNRRGRSRTPNASRTHLAWKPPASWSPLDRKTWRSWSCGTGALLTGAAGEAGACGLEAGFPGGALHVRECADASFWAAASRPGAGRSSLLWGHWNSSTGFSGSLLCISFSFSGLSAPPSHTDLRDLDVVLAHQPAARGRSSGGGGTWARGTVSPLSAPSPGGAHSGLTGLRRSRCHTSQG